MASPLAMALVATVPEGGEVLLCTCTHGPDEACPMHHGQTSSPESAPDGKWCRGCLDGSEAALTLVGLWSGAPLMMAKAFVVPAGIGMALIERSGALLDRIAPPVAPPPRS